MKLTEVKEVLSSLNDVVFEVEGAGFVPEHFHVTEVGVVSRTFIDCGGTMRQEQKINFQLWNANDFDHRLKPQKLLNIIELCEAKLALVNADVEVEYQSATIGRYDLAFNGRHFVLQSKTTACLAEDACGIPSEKQKIGLKSLGNVSSCAPGSGCC